MLAFYFVITLQFSHEVIRGVPRWLGTSWIMASSMKELRFGWKSGAWRRLHNGCNVTTLVLIWVIWK